MELTNKPKGKDVFHAEKFEMEQRQILLDALYDFVRANIQAFP